jgi:hypothetical protein
MPPIGFGKKEEPQSFTTDITDKEDLEEIKKICHMLNPNEEVAIDLFNALMSNIRSSVEC